jgi:hypothetical protein
MVSSHIQQRQRLVRPEFGNVAPTEQTEPEAPTESPRSQPPVAQRVDSEFTFCKDLYLTAEFPSALARGGTESVIV